MLPEIKWEIALYLELFDIEQSFPEILLNDIFWEALFRRDFPGMKGDCLFYRKMCRLACYSKHFGNCIVHIDILEESIVWDDFQKFAKDSQSKIYLDGVGILRNNSKWDDLFNETYRVPTCYFKNGKSFILPYNIYLIRKLEKYLDDTAFYLRYLFTSFDDPGDKTIEKIRDGLVQNRQFTLLHACSQPRMKSSELVRRIFKYESDIGYKKKLETARSEFIKMIEK